MFLIVVLIDLAYNVFDFFYIFQVHIKEVSYYISTAMCTFYYCYYYPLIKTQNYECAHTHLYYLLA